MRESRVRRPHLGCVDAGLQAAQLGALLPQPLRLLGGQLLSLCPLLSDRGLRKLLLNALRRQVRYLMRLCIFRYRDQLQGRH